MTRKQMILTLVIGIIALILACILLVGIVDGIWPWDGITAYDRLISNRLQADPQFPEKETTAPTETEGDSQGGSNQQSGNENDGTEPTRPPIGEVTQGGTPPSLPKEDLGDGNGNSNSNGGLNIDIEVEGVVIPTTGSTEGSTGSTDSTEGSTGTTEGSTSTETPGATEEKPDAVIDFSDLLKPKS